MSITVLTPSICLLYIDGPDDGLMFRAKHIVNLITPEVYYCECATLSL